MDTTINLMSVLISSELPPIQVLQLQLMQNRKTTPKKKSTTYKAPSLISHSLGRSLYLYVKSIVSVTRLRFVSEIPR